jgi:hypothetical protein
MKIMRIFFCLFIIFYSCLGKNGKSNDKPVGDSPYMYFTEESFDAGKVTQGDTVSHTFTLTNKGKTDLILQSVIAGCGCTVAKYDRKPILPETSTLIEVAFNTEGRKGVQKKNVTVISNAVPEKKVLTLKCEVLLPNKLKNK